MSKIRVGVCGATGYAGMEILKIFSHVPDVEVKFLSSESQAGQRVEDAEPSMVNYYGMKFQSVKDESIYEGIDFAFLCLPHEASAETAPKFLAAGTKTIDLSAAYRIRNLEVFEKTYKFTHPSPDWVKDAAYGLCETNAEAIRKARLIANPGCYPTSILLPVIPLYRAGLIKDKRIIADSKSSISGAGRKALQEHLYPEINENAYAYNLIGHRHRPEIEQELTVAAGSEVRMSFSPHVIPVDRGIISTIYIDAHEDIKAKAAECLSDFYAKSPFVKVFADRLPKLKWVANTNCDYIGVEFDRHTGRLILVSVLDNLIKGAAGQAVQNMNLMLGWDEKTGLI